MAASDTDTLRERLLDLPQELYDEIYNLTFTAEPGPRYIRRTHIYNLETKNPKNPTLSQATRMVHLERSPFQGKDSAALLKVDRASRRQFMESYFRGPGAVFVFSDMNKCEDWLASLKAGQRNPTMLVEIVVPPNGPRPGLRRPLSGFIVAPAKYHLLYFQEDLQELFGVGVQVQFTVRGEILDLTQDEIKELDDSDFL